MTNAPMAVRKKTRVAGVNASSATLMRRYGIPQITDMATNRVHPRLVTSHHPRWPKAEPAALGIATSL